MFPTGNNAVNNGISISAPRVHPLLHSRDPGGGIGPNESIRDLILREQQEIELDVSKWNVDMVVQWLCDNGFSNLEGNFRDQHVDGHVLLQVDGDFIKNVLMINHPILERKLLRGVTTLQEKHNNSLKAHTLDELDEYVMMLESHRIKLVAKLKTIFDRFDGPPSKGELSGDEVERALVYMNRPIDAAEVNAWLLRLKDGKINITFSEFVGQYSSLFAGSDPDIPAGDINDRPTEVDPDVGGQRKIGDDNQRGREHAGSNEKWKDADSRSRSRSSERDSSWGGRNLRNKGVHEEEIMDIKVLAELKGTFDRFAVDGLINPPEACQALCEAGLVTPRRDVAQYLRQRKMLGASRCINFYEFLRAFAAIREKSQALSGAHRDKRGALPSNRRSHRSRSRDRYQSPSRRDREHFEHRDLNNKSTRYHNNHRYLSRSPSPASRKYVHEFRLGQPVEAQYRERGRWNSGIISRVRSDGTVDIQYDDGEYDERIRDVYVRHVDVSEVIKYHKDQRIRARFQSRGAWVHGFIARERRNDMYDIEYDSGAREFNVSHCYIRSLDSDEFVNERRHKRSRSRSRSRSQSRRGARLRVGSKVKARYRGRSKYYPGKISRDRGDGTYDIDYDDGEQETRVAAELIDGGDDGAGSRSPRRGARLRVGSKVKARYRGRSKYYPGKISRDRGDGTYDIDYDDGEQETRVAAELIDGGDDGAGSWSPSRRGARLRVGSKVKARYRGRSKYYPGVISRDRGDGTYDIEYDDGEQETRVVAELIDGGDDGAGSWSPSRRGARLRVGSKVKARYRGRSKYYPGVISRDRGDGTYDIEYDDGEQETRVVAELIDGGDDGAGSRSPSRRGARLRVGSKVKARYRGRSKYYPGKISRDRGDGTYDIDYDDGEQETRVAAELIDGGDDGAGSRSPSRRGARLRVGSKVKARYRGRSKYYPGVISRDRGDGTYDIDYDDGEQETRVAAELIDGGDDGAGSRSPSRRGARLRVGSKVKARYRGRSKYYPGVISRDRGDGTYDIDYDDGEQETRVAAELIDGGDDGAGSRSPSRRGARLRVGSKVKARYRGRSKYYPGVISRDRGDGTYDIDYDDGEQETRVAAELIDGGDGGVGSRSPSRRGARLRVGS